MNRALALVAGLVATAGGVCGAERAVQPAQVTSGGTQPVVKNDKPKVYDESADAKQQIAAAVASAKRANRRVLVQWGGNWCGWCIKLHGLMTSDEKIKRELLYEYDVVHVDAGKPAGKNIDLAKSYGAMLEKDGFPFLTVLDGDGKPVANQETSSLEKKDGQGGSVLGAGMGHDPAKVLKFLREHEATPLEAKKVVDAGIEEAKKSGKVVFLHFGAPWCGWCHRLEGWMARPDVAALLSKAFVDVKVDTDRMTGGPDVLRSYHPKGGGIPWFAFIDGEGKVVVTSDGANGNVGFPAEKAELEHFASMLEKAGLSAEERAKLVETLRNDKAASGTH
ncbi:MAG: thioredoxin family protein [Phycisphaerales bacterium]|nr:thioredoxin family protein [Phycisphaerales bacterium]